MGTEARGRGHTTSIISRLSYRDARDHDLRASSASQPGAWLRLNSNGRYTEWRMPEGIKTHTGKDGSVEPQDEHQRPLVREEGTRTGDVDRERRLVALAKLAGRSQESGERSGQFTEVGKRQGARRSPRLGRRRIALIATAVLMVFVGAGGIIVHAALPGQTAHPSVATTSIKIDLKAKGLFCPQRLVWSPDSLHLAVYAQPHDCADSTNQTLPVVGIFDARTGQQEQVLEPYATLGRLGVKAPLVGDALWAPDGKSLLFIVGYDPNRIDANPISGLLSLPLGSGTPRFVSGGAIHQQCHLEPA